MSAAGSRRPKELLQFFKPPSPPSPNPSSFFPSQPASHSPISLALEKEPKEKQCNIGAMQSVPTFHGSQPSGGGQHTIQTSAPKIKKLACSRCTKTFGRTEHLQRHMRTHTKERPFTCEICQKSFTRKDLLKRHDGLVHAEVGEARSAAAGLVHLGNSTVALANSEDTFRTMGSVSNVNTVDLRNDSEPSNNMPFAPMGFLPKSTLGPYLRSSDDALQPGGVLEQSLGYSGDQIEDVLTDFTGFMDQVGFDEDWQAVGLVVQDDQDFTSLQEYHQPDPVRSIEHIHHVHNTDQRHSSEAENEEGGLSRFASLPPPLQPEAADRSEAVTQLLHRRSINQTFASSATSAHGPNRIVPWNVTQQTRLSFLKALHEFDSILPQPFLDLSKDSFTRLLSGYFLGFDDHLPFIHRATFSFGETAPELILALCTIGAYYKFERQKGLELFYTAKAIALEQVRRRDSRNMTQRSSRVSTSLGDTDKTPDSEGVDISRPRGFMHTLQALILLMAFASWDGSLVHEALSFQSTIARLVREHGLRTERSVGKHSSWVEWSSYEADKRTKLVAYCFFNLQTIAFDIPPQIHSDEVKLFLPCSAAAWNATNTSEWNATIEGGAELEFQDVLMKLFDHDDLARYAPVTPFGKYVLIHALLQQIYITKQLHKSLAKRRRGELQPDDVKLLEHSLKNWKSLWKHTKDSDRAIDPRNPDGPVAFKSTALLGLAYNRLNTTTGPLRRLELQDAELTAQSLYAAPSPSRTPHMTMALLHSAHSLNIVVKLGISFVSETQALFWSVQHALCSMEGAFLLSKWLMSLSFQYKRSENPLTKNEQRLLLWVYRMTEETDFALRLDFGGSNRGVEECFDMPDVPRQLAIAVVKTWAKIFQGPLKWPIVDLIGKSLEVYGDLLRKNEEARTTDRMEP